MTLLRFVLFVGAEHTPVAGLQVPGSWHWSAVQTTGFAPTQLPFWQASVCVQASPSLQAVPSSFSGAAQVTAAAGQEPAASRCWRDGETTGFAPTQRACWQAWV